MSQVVKVYQIANDLGMDDSVVLAKIRAFGIQVNNKMSKVDGAVAEQIKASLLKEKQGDWIEIELPGGIKKRVKKTPPAAAAPPPPPPAAERVAPPKPEPVRVVEEASAPVAEAAPPVPPAVEAPTPTRVEAPARPAPAVEPEPVVEKPAPPATAAAVTPAPSAPAQPSPVPVAERAAAPANSEPAREAVQPPPARVAEPAPAPPAAEPTPTPVAVTPPPTATAPAPAVVEPVREVAQPEPAQPEPAPAEAPRSEPPATRASPSAPPTPEARPASIPPAAPRRGISTWDPVTRQVIHSEPPPSAAPATGPSRRSVEVAGSRLMGAGARAPVRTLPGRPGARPTGPGVPGRPGPRAVGRPAGPRGPVPPPTQMAEHKRKVQIEGSVPLQELARRMSIKASEVLLKLLQMGMTGVNINTTLDADTAKIIASEFGYQVEDVAVNVDEALKAILPEFKDNPADYVERAPVVTVMGHVDHGKTTLLDAILGTRVAEGEAGGITQKVSAYRVETKKGPVVFFDTPGHEAFTKLRARGAETTDVAVLVVAADDGVMPTTIEAINHIKAANVPIVVALNKIDKPDAKPDRVTQQLMEYDVVPEQYGGDTIVVPVSAKQKLNIDQLLENLALQSEILELKANPKKPGKGTVFDATLDKGRGVVARVLVQDGTIRTGDVVLAGTSYGKIRAMFDDRGKPIAKAGPSTPVEILGLNEVPNAGDAIHVVKDIKSAQAFADEHKKQAARPAMPSATQTIEDILRTQAEGQVITIGVIIKAEAQASVEALSKALTELSTDKVKIQIVHTGIGGITESDVNLAVASKMLTRIIGFNVRPQGKAAQLAESEKVDLRLYNIIYEAVDDMKALMIGQLKPTYVEKALGKAEVRQVFNISKVGTVAGCYVTDGQIKRSARARLVRDSVQVWEGRLASLKRFKEDAKEVAQGYECGIGLENYNDLKPGDVIEAFELEEVAAKL